MLKKWLEERGEVVVLSREPGGTDLGQGLRKILLGHETGEISPRAEALLYAADRAHHVFSVIRPALANGEVVISDRYFDSSIAYQGAGRVLSPGEVARISRWATESLFPTLTIVIDLPAEIGIGRLKNPDRLESEPLVYLSKRRFSGECFCPRCESSWIPLETGRRNWLHRAGGIAASLGKRRPSRLCQNRRLVPKRGGGGSPGQPHLIGELRLLRRRPH
jgi:dTMP kinase